MVVGVGVDILEAARFRRILERYGVKFLRRHFTPQEMEQGERSAVPYRRFAEGLAGKEAALKALQLDWKCGVFWREIAVLAERYPVFRVELIGQARRRAEELQVSAIHLSIARSRDYVVAVAVANADTGPVTRCRP